MDYAPIIVTFYISEYSYLLASTKDLFTFNLPVTNQIRPKMNYLRRNVIQHDYISNTLHHYYYLLLPIF
ncbi:MAG TPA: hypothetical protein VIW25_03025, partial [Nitrososphaeraceae archaeon]